MILSYKSRRPAVGDLVKVHRNLADRDGTQVWSILGPGGLVVGHADTLVLREVEFRVRTGGNARARATRQRNVHAFAVGRLAVDGTAVRADTGVHYNPFRAATFTDDTGEEILSATKVLFDSDGNVWAQ